MKKLLTVLFLIYAMVLMACPRGEKTFRKAQEASVKVQIYSLKLIEANVAAYKAGEISLETKDKIAALTGKLVKGIKIYRNAVGNSEQMLKNGQPLDGNSLATLNRIFDMEVVAPFLGVLTQINLLSGDKSELIKTIISSIRVAIVTISDTFAQSRQQFAGGKLEWT